ncbi:30S ribosomal protein S14 [Helcobacillus massiliensis]|uniref:Small ribosomal subunit protein uS14 n=1 Tax=Helcobacillus massiliensis TaxID=521392 RepID=A0A839QU35_9MICO|nr:30S ribosomal protein S14 [Helcobacillus massiliensis]MBB3023148.1 small subunit ribosomal protein S14 [Helcobacillus massiliensis]
MAKTSKIARNRQREQVVAKFADRRAELKRTIKDPASSPEQRAAAQAELQRQPRDASATRLRNRDRIDGRPRSVYRKFGLSRVRLRELAHRGELPGITKSSW